MESRRLTALIALGFLLVAVVAATLIDARLQPPRLTGAVFTPAATGGPTAPQTTLPSPARPSVATAPAPAGPTILPPVIEVIRVAPSGEAVLAGTAEPGARVEVLE